MFYRLLSIVKLTVLSIVLVAFSQVHLAQADYYSEADAIRNTYNTLFQAQCEINWMNTQFFVYTCNRQHEDLTALAQAHGTTYDITNFCADTSGLNYCNVPPQIEVSSRTFSFPYPADRLTSVRQEIKVTNLGTEDLVLTGWAESDDVFSFNTRIDDDDLGVKKVYDKFFIEPGVTYVTEVSFSPWMSSTGVIPNSGTITLVSNSTTDDVLVINMSVTGGPGSTPPSTQQCPSGQTWNGAACVTDCPVGQIWDSGLNQCVYDCPTGQVWDGNQCVHTCPVDQVWDGVQCIPQGNVVQYSVQLISGSVPVVADGKHSAQYKVILKNTITGERIPATIKAVRSSWASSSDPVGSVLVTPVTDGYTVNYTAPNLIGGNKNIESEILSIQYTNPVSGGAASYGYDVKIAVGQAFYVIRKGFQRADGNVVFTNPNARVKVVSAGKKTPIKGATVSLDDGTSVSLTDRDGYVTLSSLTSTLTGPVTETVIEMPLDPVIYKSLHEARKNYNDVGIRNLTVRSFITQFETFLAIADNDADVDKQIAGLTRTKFALFFIKSGKLFGYETADELGATVDGAFSDLNDLLDVTGKISKKLLGKFEDKIKNNKYAKQITEKVEKLTQKLFDKLVDTLGRAIGKFAEEYAKGWLGSVVDDMKKNSMNNNLYDPVWKKIGLKDWLTNKFKSKIDGNAGVLLTQIAGHIQRNDWQPAPEADLEQAKSSHASLLENYIQAHEANYNITLTKAGIKSLLDAAQTINNFYPAYKAYIEAADKIYKVARSAFLNNLNIYYWFDITGKAISSSKKSVDYALGDGPRAQMQDSMNDLLAAVDWNVEYSPEEYHDQYELAVLDQEFYQELVSLIDMLKAGDPANTELDELRNTLQQELTNATTTVNKATSSQGADLAELQNEWQPTIYPEVESDVIEENEIGFGSSLPTTTVSGNSCFSDTVGHVYETAICKVKEWQVVEGYSDGTFRPDQAINRAEFVKILIATSYTPNEIVGGGCFPDVGNEWFAPYICKAKSANIVGGNSDGTFTPANNVNLAEALKIVLNTFQYPLVGNNTNPWYQIYMDSAENYMFLDTINSDPAHSLTRGEMAELIVVSGPW